LYKVKNAPEVIFHCSQDSSLVLKMAVTARIVILSRVHQSAVEAARKNKPRLAAGV
jgi:hypothetical protein